MLSVRGAELSPGTSNTGSVQVRVAGKESRTFNESDLASLPRSSVTAGAHDEKPSLWEGVTLVELLQRAGAPLDKQLRGREMARFVRVTAADGYQVVFSLAELDAAFGDRNVLVVDRQDGHPLSGKDGPLRLVVAGDKRPARWVREVETIEVVDGSVPGHSSLHDDILPGK
ncbi:hypothetical protein B0E50_12760 [Rhodanobacter sp. C01]|nr:hypothetical protein B0E50_12760 [Rhodanobacter sp. C01]